MNDVVNLRTVRKQKTREEHRQVAAQNAINSGLSKAQRILAASRSDVARRKLDEHKLTGMEEE
ncbi:hypothetical protein BV394_02680 [Brevirhabdus pacifica]|uniref:Uncharacterized protein n=1 Tax=Brevirhabdus pacifica TaxID=1267768 RepID=A0A1U7DFI7_9RHOB|nr:DUF4169 family protein [Brevirhabdus pacifica]APX88770.1 hypothetical protein BV394_02680 [Brevirhabdus pacifica]OWU80024.1 hypothetical protein ATO5_03360 [Loktanella sp. 22II-4b]PJJ86704.1 uncharacterized protein DUF4169 [Brevirhabdus pacifica]